MKVKIVTTAFALIIHGTKIHILVVYRELLWVKNCITANY